MTSNQFPPIELADIAATKSALHAYAHLMGTWLKLSRAPRKHWWHTSLRPSLNGVTTGVVYASINFEIELNMRNSLLQVRTSLGHALNEPLQGQSVAQLAANLNQFLISCGISAQSIPELTAENTHQEFVDYSPQQARVIADVLASVTAVMTRFRADIAQETSPIQLWPHHFDLSMLWFNGAKVDGQDPDNAESADKQLNFGFTFGDESIPEPYFYVTAYPLPPSLSQITLPAGSVWHTHGFSGAVLLYKGLIDNNPAPADHLLALWRTLLAAGQESL